MLRKIPVIFAFFYHFGRKFGGGFPGKFAKHGGLLIPSLEQWLGFDNRGLICHIQAGIVEAAILRILGFWENLILISFSDPR